MRNEKRFFRPKFCFSCRMCPAPAVALPWSVPAHGVRREGAAQGSALHRASPTVFRRNRFFHSRLIIYKPFLQKKKRLFLPYQKKNAMVMYIGCGICGESWQVLCYSPEVLKNSGLLFFLEKSVGKALFSVYRGRKTLFRPFFCASLCGRELYRGCSRGYRLLFHAFFHRVVKGAISAEKFTFAV